MSGPGKDRSNPPPPGSGLPPSTPPREEFQSAVREVMDHVAGQRTTVRRGSREGSWRPRILILLSLAFLGVGVWNVFAFQDDQRPAFDDQRIEESVRASIFLTAMGLEDYRSRRGMYPPSLPEAGLEAPGLLYRVEGNGYVLESRSTAVSIRYVSGEDLSPFELALDAILISVGRGA